MSERLCVWITAVTLTCGFAGAGSAADVVEQNTAGPAEQSSRAIDVTPTLPADNQPAPEPVRLHDDADTASFGNILARPLEGANTQAERKRVLLQRIAEGMEQPAEDAPPVELRRRLSQLIRDSADLALLAEDDALTLEAHSVHMQALHAYVTAFRDDPRVDTYLDRLRGTAEQTRALAEPQAKAVGGFWLLSADLVEIGRTTASISEQREQMKPLLERFARRHDDHPAGYAARQMLRKLASPATPPSADPLSSPSRDEGEPEPPSPEPPRFRPAFRLPFTFEEPAENAASEAPPAEASD